jgi:AcrR family transcriptional regulator
MVMGRPRTFDMDTALDLALEVFWRHGYEGASIAELTKAMGINPPSLYAAFGNKEALFRKALERYTDQRARFWNEALDAPTARAMVEQLLRGVAAFLSEECDQRGCLMVRSTVSCGETADKIRREVMARGKDGEAAIRNRLERARAEGDLPADIDPADFARYIITLVEGLSVRAASGANRDDLMGVVGTALRQWPR